MDPNSGMTAGGCSTFDLPPYLTTHSLARSDCIGQGGVAPIGLVGERFLLQIDVPFSVAVVLVEIGLISVLVPLLWSAFLVIGLALSGKEVYPLLLVVPAPIDPLSAEVVGSALTLMAATILVVVVTLLYAHLLSTYTLLGMSSSRLPPCTNL